MLSRNFLLKHALLSLQGVQQPCEDPSLESSLFPNSKEDLKVSEYLGGKTVYGNTVADRISEEFYRALPSGH
jgi:hypothetical protein